MTDTTVVFRASESYLPKRVMWVLPTLALCALASCGILPSAGPNLNPDPAAIVSQDTNGQTTTLVYTKTMMNRAEAEVYAQIVCEQSDQTLEVLRHPAPTAGPTASVIFTCRRPFR